MTTDDDKITVLKAIANAIGALSDIRIVGPSVGSFGTFTMAAAALTVVPNITIKSSPASAVLLFPANAAAATLQGSAKSLYAAIADYVDGVSFTARTSNATSAAGTEIFHYLVVN